MNLEDIGIVSEPGALYMSVHVGTASSDSHKFRLLTSLSGSPMVECVETKKTFSVDWRDLVQLAIERGITKE